MKMRAHFFDIQLFMNSDLQMLEGRTPLILQCYLPYKHSFIALGNYTAANKAHLLFSAVPILLRHRFASDGKNHEVWIIPASDDLYTSELAFEGHYDIGGNIHVQTRIEDEDKVTVFSIGEGEGWVSLRPLKASKSSNNGNLFIIALNQSNLLTLNATFKDDYHWTKSNLNNDEDYDNVEIATWGSYDTYLDKSTGQLDVKFMKQAGSSSSKLYLLKTDSAPIADSRFKQSSLFEGLPFIFELPLDYPNDLVPNKLECPTFDWKVRYTQWDQAPWTSIAKTGSKFELNAIDMRHTTGHCAYMSTFEITDPQPSSAVYLKLDLRHRGTVWINGHYVGSMTVFSRQIFMAGCHCGPELLPGRYKSFDVTRFLKYPVGSGSELNKVVILTESFGINRQSMMFDDARNPRGLLHATWSNLNFKTPPKWYVTGIDSQDNHNSYQSSGLFDESTIHSSSDWSPSEALTSMSQINHSTITWYSCKFRHPLSEESLSSPTELNYPLQVHLKGPFIGYIWINKVLIGRYYGNNIGPQKHFYIMEGLLKEDEDNELILAIYPGSLTDLDPKAKSTVDIMNSPIQVEIGPWYVELSDVNQSGNLLPKLEGGIPFIYANTSLQIMNH
ncbi:hypothetical protein CONCODRAFT_102301 [Conidiobolus coronatus NRRL 28638]|uniref:beta-galactosidase n=1 Tax=Conidiobolus coronatus (strain ATCC 28846 / CBS 209.66 / NRRL 28638) TaxID=796925 RepID=A0A137PFS6_CONC2|nr:hypothetical protein CONCODRAFT_102301 [Conidiobolus coronatus NRRL 28638]|eukprot:KXN73825.1 hypothetical protein CONCODRAFT_102301 [Conidiobolus coronatus NRRL 28638]